MRSTVGPFSDSLLDEAAVLLARRQQRDRMARPLLPSRFEEADVALRAVATAWRAADGRGAAAMEGGRLLGYLLGETAVDTLRGRVAWIRPAGHALDPDAPPSLYADLYAAVSPSWVRAGCFDHYVLVSAGDRASLDAWFRLGFGMEQTHAIRALSEVPEDHCSVSVVAPDGPSGIGIRRAASDDRERLLQLAPLIAAHQSGAPVWAPAPPEFLATLREGYAEALQDSGTTFWLAFRGDQVLAFQGYFTATAGDDDLLTPERAVELSVAATRPEERGKGIGAALTRHGLAAAAREGHEVCTTDWRETNLPASRFWRAQGFHPAFHRLCSAPRPANRLGARLTLDTRRERSMP